MNRQSPPPELASADLLLVRHAGPELRAGVKASEWRLGADAEEATAALATEIGRLLGPTGRRVTRLWSSMEPKAVGTAGVLASAWGLHVEQLEDLGEHRRGPLPIVGDLEWRETIAALFANPDELVLGSETATQASRRFTTAIETLLRLGGAGGMSAVATHATVMTLLLAEPNGVGAMTLWGSLGMPDALFVDSRRDFRIVGRAWRDTP